MLPVEADCRSSPLMRVRSRSCCGSGISSAVTMHGPIGHAVSNALPRPDLVPGEALFVPAHLPLARRDVVCDGVTEDVLERALDRDVPSGLADHDRELGLGVELLRQSLVVDDGVAGADHAVGGLHEELRLLARDRRVRLLLIVVGVVAPAAENRRRDDRRCEPHGRERSTAGARGDGLARGLQCCRAAGNQLLRVADTRELDDRVAVERADTRGALGNESNDLHSVFPILCTTAASRFVSVSRNRSNSAPSRKLIGVLTLVIALLKSGSWTASRTDA